MPETVTLVCDFCAKPEPDWIFPARDFLTGSVSSEGEEHGSFGGWAACGDCRAVVEEGIEPTIQRATERFMEKHPVPDLPSYREGIAAALRTTYERFFDNRLGPPVRLSELTDACEHPIDRAIFSEEGKGSWFLPTGYYCGTCGSPVPDPSTEEEGNG
jgi:hypothetical protein